MVIGICNDYWFDVNSLNIEGCHRLPLEKTILKRSKNAIRGSRISVKTRVKVDELKILLKNYFFFIDSLIFLFFLISLKTCMYMNMACWDCLRAFNMKKNYWLKKKNTT